MKTALLLVSHAMVLALGFALGVYFLPILTAPPAPAAPMLEKMAAEAKFRGMFDRNLAGSDFLHWGEGEVSIGRDAIVLSGRLAPGPDYRLYLSPEFVDDEASFLKVKGNSAEVGAVKTFENFIVEMPRGLDPARYTTVVVWCETFGEFITAARYR